MIFFPGKEMAAWDAWTQDKPPGCSSTSVWHLAPFTSPVSRCHPSKSSHPTRDLGDSSPFSSSRMTLLGILGESPASHSLGVKHFYLPLLGRRDWLLPSHALQSCGAFLSASTLVTTLSLLWTLWHKTHRSCLLVLQIRIQPWGDGGGVGLCLLCVATLRTSQ